MSAASRTCGEVVWWANSLTRLRTGWCALRNGQVGTNQTSLMLHWRARRAVQLDPCAAW
jgi:hypothetical protein